MIDLFSVDADVEKVEEKDGLPFGAWESDIYDAVLKTAYIDRFSGGSVFVNCVYELTDLRGNKITVQERETIWSVKTQGGHYICQKTGKKKQLIGQAKMDSLAKLLTGKSLKEIQDTGGIEDKTHKIYSSELKKETPQTKPTIMAFTNVPCYVGLKKIIENKQTKQGDTYVMTAETREVNQVEKVFNSDRKTLLEVQANSEAEYFNDWLNINKGKTIDKTKKVDAQPGLPSGTPSQSLQLDI